ncbi:MAG: hypothetical protein H0U53_04325 [Actinobacteria bacterium]|nr:hypothetical protein [Actinomycetota bacterium]
MQVGTPDQGQAKAAEQHQKNVDAIEALEPSVAERDVTFDWVLPDGKEVRRVYTQAMLGMFPAQEFGTIVTSILKSFVQGDMGLKLGELFRGEVSMPTSFDADAVDKTVDENVHLISAFIKLVEILPEFQLDVLCLSLGVPRKECAWAKEQMQEPPRRGGLTVIEGFDLLKVFIQQNAELVRETVTGKARELVDVFRLEVLGHDLKPEPGQEDETPSSTPMNTSTDQPIAPWTSPSSHGLTPSSTSSPATPASD